MRSSFFEFNIATTGLFTSRNAITVAGHNIANRNTTGYSRQVALQKADTPMSLAGGKGMLGTGSVSYGIGQIRSFYLDQRYWATNSTLGEYSSKRTQTSLLQAIFNETDSVGFNVATDNFFNTLQSLTESSGDVSYRNAAVQSALSLTQYFNDTARALQEQQKDINNEVKLMVTQINTIGRQLQNLNKQIYMSELDGSNANDLRDQRATLIDELSRYVNVEVSEKDLSTESMPNNKQFSVSINGFDFVNHFEMNELEVRERTVKNNPEDVDNLYDIYWKSTGVKLNSVNSMATLKGELKGLLDIRDGNNLNTFSGTITGMTQDSNGFWEVTLSGWNRNDMSETGNIVINGKTYAYSDFTYDPATDTVKVKIPPSEGKMTVGSTVVSYSNLTMNPDGSIASFETSPPLTDKQLSQKIKIGDMTIDGTLAIDSSTTPPTINVTGNTAGSQLAAAEAIVTGGGAITATIGTKVNAKGIPYYMSKLNTYVRALAQLFNEGTNINGDPVTGLSCGHKDAYSEADGSTGYNFFSYFENITGGEVFSGTSTIDYSKITASNFTVAAELVEDPTKLATAVNENNGISDNNWILEIISTKHNSEVLATGELGNFIQSVQGELAVEASQAELFEKNYVSVLTTVENQRLSVSGVDENEEMANVVRFQQTFNACAKLINVIDEIYDTLINGLGIT